MLSKLPRVSIELTSTHVLIDVQLESTFSAHLSKVSSRTRRHSALAVNKINYTAVVIELHEMKQTLQKQNIEIAHYSKHSHRFTISTEHQSSSKRYKRSTGSSLKQSRVPITAPVSIRHDAARPERSHDCDCYNYIIQFQEKLW